MDISKYVSLTIGVAVIAIIIGVMGPIIASNLLPTTGDTGVLDNAGTINTLIQLGILFIPIILILALVRGAMSKQ